MSLVPAGGLVWLLLFPPGGWAAEEAGSSQAKASFGEVIERRLPALDFAVPNQVLLNLDNGELLSMPTNVWMAGLGFDPRPACDWMVKHGADLLAHSSQGSTNLSFHLDDGWLAVLGTNLTFESIAASNVSPALERSLFQHLAVVRPDQGPGATLVFKTREGNLGVMQLLGFQVRPEPVLKLRYKLVRPAPRSQ